MINFGVIGTSHRVRPIEEIGRYHLGEDPSPSLERLKINLELEDLLHLSTCNRVEFWYRTDSDTPSEKVLESVMEIYREQLGEALDLNDFYHYQQQDAARHIMRVAASLDSLVVGEVQILEQIKAAHAKAVDERLAGAGITRLLEIAYQAVKEIRRETSLTEGLVSVASLASAEVINRVEVEPSVLLVGAGETMDEAGSRLLDNPQRRAVDFTVTNRSPGRALTLAEKLGGEALPFAEAFESAPPLHAVMVATSSPTPVLTTERLAKLAANRADKRRPLLVLDLSLPSDVDAKGLDDIEVISIEDLRARAEENLETRRAHAREAERIIDGKLTVMERRLANQAVGPVVGMVQSRFKKTMERQVRHLIDHQLTGLNDLQKEQLERWASSTAKRLAGLHLEHAKRMLAACSHCPPEAPCLVAMGFKKSLSEEGGGCPAGHGS